jgi:hypothetical protein
METVFDRFDKTQIGESTATEVLSFVQNKSMGELLSQDEQTIVSWSENGNGAVADREINRVRLGKGIPSPTRRDWSDEKVGNGDETISVSIKKGRRRLPQGLREW